MKEELNVEITKNVNSEEIYECPYDNTRFKDKISLEKHIKFAHIEQEKRK